MIPFVGPSHPLPLDRVDLQRSINLRPVSAEAPGEKVESHLLPTPGLSVWSAYVAVGSFLSIDNASGAAADGLTYTLTVTRTGVTTGTSRVTWTATGDTYDGTEGFQRVAYTGELAFAAGETTKTIVFTLHVTLTLHFDLLVTLSAAVDAIIADGTGTIAADGAADLYFANVGYLLHLNDPTNPYTFTDVKGNAWAREGTGQPANFTLSGAQKKFGDGALLVKTAGGTSDDYSIAATPAGGAYAMAAGNSFTLEGWLYWTGNINSRPSVGAVQDNLGAVICAIEFNDAVGSVRFRTNLNSVLDDRALTPPLNQWVHLALTFDGTTKRWFVNGVLQGSAALGAGSARTVGTYRCRGIASGDVNAPVAYIDDLRFTFNVCRYTADFTPPSAAFPDVGP